jgi:hypothetical protein
MVTLANEMGISPESFIKRGLDNEDLRNTGDDVIWSVEGLEEAPPPPLRRGTRPAFAPLFAEESQLKASKKEKIEKANIANDLSYALDLYDLAGISDEHAFLACIEDDGIKADANGFSKILEGRNMEISFPLRVDMLGRFDNREHWYPWSRRSDRIIGRPRSPFLNSCEVETPVGGCWQFYVTGTPSSAKKIIRHVLPYLHRYNIGYKIISNIGSMRRLYFSSRVENESQYGEFIIICPPTCRESQIIAEDLNSILTNGGFKMGGINIPSHAEEDRQRFTEKDFVTLCGNYSVGTSGGLFARYVSDYDKENSPEDEKKAPVILESLLENASEYAPCNLTYCGLSFGEGDDFIENVKILGLENQG